MKKLMFGLALALSATCLADAIESNIVGYSTYDLANGVTLFTAPFQKVNTSSTVDIQDLKIVYKGGDVTGGDATEFIDILDENGIATGETYYWLLDDVMGEGKDGWYKVENGAYVYAENVPIKGIYVYVDNPDTKAQLLISGVVKETETTLDIYDGVNLVGNATPITLDIQSIKLDNSAGDATEFIDILDENGIATGETYYWLLDDVMGEGKDGWYKVEDGAYVYLEKDEVTLAPGKGLYLYKDFNGCETKFVLPSPTAKQ